MDLLKPWICFRITKAGSVFATGDEAEPVLTSAKHDPRLRTVVCRHWLRDLCMKGSACEFLHQYDLGKMPLCRHGERCKINDCPFRHISEANRLECVFYSQGSCIHGDPFVGTRMYEGIAWICRLCQIRIRVSLECPALEDTDPALNDVLGSLGSGRIGALTFAQTEAIASLLASQCGALQYMMDYQQGLKEGVHVNPPPIALPPKKIQESTDV